MIVVKRIFNLVLPIALLIMVFMEVPQRSITDNDGVEIDDNKKLKRGGRNIYCLNSIDCYEV
jgi:hypothetical protein